MHDSIKNPVPLYNLLKPEVREQLDGLVFLSEDVYFKDILVLKSGAFLDEQSIFRLLNLGIKKVKIILGEKNTNSSPFDNLSILSLKKQILKSQKCLIADKNAFQINSLISLLTTAHIKEANIFAANNSIPLKKLIEDKEPRFIFIDLNLYPSNGLKIIKEIKKITLGKVFLTAMVDQSKTELVQKLRREVELNNATLLLKPISPAHLRMIMINSITNADIKRYLAKKKLVRKGFKSA